VKPPAERYSYSDDSGRTYEGYQIWDAEKHVVVAKVYNRETTERIVAFLNGPARQRAWQTKEERILRKMWAAGDSLKQIGSALGRSSASVDMYRRKIGLPSRYTGPMPRVKGRFVRPIPYAGAEKR
jgi:hypothetical protein